MKKYRIKRVREYTNICDFCKKEKSLDKCEVCRRDICSNCEASQTQKAKIPFFTLEVDSDIDLSEMDVNDCLCKDCANVLSQELDKEQIKKEMKECFIKLRVLNSL